MHQPMLIVMTAATHSGKVLFIGGTGEIRFYRDLFERVVDHQ
jgi:hypothetical protein